DLSSHGEGGGSGGFAATCVVAAVVGTVAAATAVVGRVVAGRVVAAACVAAGFVVACARSLRRSMITSVFFAGLVVGAGPGGRSVRIDSLLTCSGRISSTFLSRSSMGFLLSVSKGMTATFTIAGVSEIRAKSF